METLKKVVPKGELLTGGRLLVRFLKDQSCDQFYLIFSLINLIQKMRVCQKNLLMSIINTGDYHTGISECP